MDLHTFGERKFTLNFGADRPKLYVPESLLKKNASLLDENKVDQWKDSWPEVIAIGGNAADPQTWADLLYWISRGKVTRIHQPPKKTGIAADERLGLEQSYLKRYVRAYELAERGDYELIQNKIVDVTYSFLNDEASSNVFAAATFLSGGSGRKPTLIRDMLLNDAFMLLMDGCCEVGVDGDNFNFRKWSRNDLVFLLQSVATAATYNKFGPTLPQSDKEFCKRFHKHMNTERCFEDETAELGPQQDPGTNLEPVSQPESTPARDSMREPETKAEPEQQTESMSERVAGASSPPPGMKLVASGPRIARLDTEISQSPSQKHAQSWPSEAQDGLVEQDGIVLEAGTDHSDDDWLVAWDHGLDTKERNKLKKQMKRNGTWETRITKEMIDERQATPASAGL